MRQVGEGMHEDVYVTNHTQIPVQVTLELQFEYAFTSQTEAESGRKQFGHVQVTWPEAGPGTWEQLADYQVEHHYSHQGESGLAKMNRGLLLRIQNATSPPQRSQNSISFPIELQPHGAWHACLSWIGSLEGKLLPLTCRCPWIESGDYDRRRTELLRDCAVESPEEHIRCSDVGWVRMHRLMRARECDLVRSCRTA
jgi:hypothetical protein